MAFNYVIKIRIVNFLLMLFILDFILVYTILTNFLTTITQLLGGAELLNSISNRSCVFTGSRLSIFGSRFHE